MKLDQIASLLTAVTERVYGDSDKVTLGSSPGTGPVKLSVGYVSKTNMVMHDGIVITDAPAAIINVVMDWVHKQKAEDPHCSIRAEAGAGGLVIR